MVIEWRGGSGAGGGVIGGGIPQWSPESPSRIPHTDPGMEHCRQTDTPGRHTAADTDS